MTCPYPVDFGSSIKLEIEYGSQRRKLDDSNEEKNDE